MQGEVMSESTSKALKIALLVGQGLILVGAYLWVPPHEGLGNLGRIAIFHIPTAWVATVAFLVAMFYGIQYLRTRRLDNDLRSAASAELGRAIRQVVAEDCLALVEAVTSGERPAEEVRSIASDAPVLHPLFLRRVALAAGAVAALYLLTRRRRTAR